MLSTNSQIWCWYRKIFWQMSILLHNMVRAKWKIFLLSKITSKTFLYLADTEPYCWSCLVLWLYKPAEISIYLRLHSACVQVKGWNEHESCLDVLGETKITAHSVYIETFELGNIKSEMPTGSHFSKTIFDMNNIVLPFLSLLAIYGMSLMFSNFL